VPPGPNIDPPLHATFNGQRLVSSCILELQWFSHRRVRQCPVLQFKHFHRPAVTLYYYIL